MTAPTHVLIGFSGVVFCGHAAGLNPGPLGLFAVIVGSLAPDIDGNGTIRKPGILVMPFVGWRVAKALDIVVELFARLLNLLLGHRGFLHAPLLGLALLVVGGISNANWLYWFGLGYVLHIYGDYMTVAGIPAFSPFSRHTYSGSNLRVGSRGEDLLALLLVIILCIAGWPLLPETIRMSHIAFLEKIRGTRTNTSGVIYERRFTGSTYSQPQPLPSASREGIKTNSRPSFSTVRTSGNSSAGRLQPILSSSSSVIRRGPSTRAPASSARSFTYRR